MVLFKNKKHILVITKSRLAEICDPYRDPPISIVLTTFISTTTSTRLNINGATAQMIADHIKGIGLKTAREIKDLQMSLSGEKFANLEQLKEIKRVDWESVIAADLIRV